MVLIKMALHVRQISQFSGLKQGIILQTKILESKNFFNKVLIQKTNFIRQEKDERNAEQRLFPDRKNDINE